MAGPSSFSPEPCTAAPPPTSAVAFSFSAFLLSLSLSASLPSPSRLLSLLPLMVLKGEFEDGVGFEFMVLWVDFLGEDFGFLDEPVWGVIG
jgi:hypothetical protein